MKALLVGICCISYLGLWGQYAPQAGLAGSDALSAGSGAFVGWATGCSIYRGYMNIADTALGLASAGDSSMATGPADDYTVSLGDSGVAVLTFAHPIYNGPGPDFAVYENAFLNPANDSQAFLELGFVEVSSDGIHYTRFPATSLTQDSVQATNDTYLYANSLHNLAGNYIAMWGTPFDLEELAGTEGLDINRITHVRVVDAIGAISGHSSHDSAGRVVNDPWPTPYPSCGFDLDAVGVLHELNVAVGQLQGNLSVRAWPNPAADELSIAIPATLVDGVTATITSLTCSPLQAWTLMPGIHRLPVAAYPAGMYYLTIRDTNGNQWVEKICKY